VILIAVLSRNAVHQAEPKTPVVNLFLVEPGGSPFKTVNGEFAHYLACLLCFRLDPSLASPFVFFRRRGPHSQMMRIPLLTLAGNEVIGVQSVPVVIGNMDSTTRVSPRQTKDETIGETKYTTTYRIENQLQA
jgi:hypothetical protein